MAGHLDGALPVSAMAAAPFFALIGGHDCVLNSAVFAIVTDLTDDLVQRCVSRPTIGIPSHLFP